ncbi:MAG: hypothetical protein ABW182_07230 [Sphingomonas sp.]
MASARAKVRLTMLTLGAPARARAAAAPRAAPPAPALSSAYERTLFAAPAGLAAERAPQDAPALVGIVGRLDQDAVALVKTAEGSTRTLAVGASVDGWKLESLSIDAGYFTRGAQRVRVPLPTADGAAAAADEPPPAQ